MSALYPVDDELVAALDTGDEAVAGGVENMDPCGQVIYIDGGSDAVMWGDSVW
jgi:hypothetical protein